MRVREGRDRPVAERKARVLSELVEAVLRRHTHRNSRQRAGELSIYVGVHEMRVQDLRPLAREVRAEPQEGNRIDVRRKRDRVQWDAAIRELARKVPRTWLVLVQHQEPDIPTALLEAREEREQMRLRPGDACHFLQMQEEAVAVHRTAARIPSAQVSTE